MRTLFSTILICVIVVHIAGQSAKCPPSFKFYHIPHGAINAWIDQPVLNGLFKSAYMIRTQITRVNNKPTVALTVHTDVLYLIQSECYGASPKGGPSVTLIDGKTNSTQVTTYPTGSKGKPFIFISPRGEQLVIECVDTLLFAFNILLKNSNLVVAQIRNMNIPSAQRGDIKDIFTLEVNDLYKDLTAFFISVSLVVDEHIYPASIKQKREYCK